MWSKRKRTAYYREYRQRAEVKARRKEYEQRPERKEKRKEYRLDPEVRIRRKEYEQSTEVKLRVIEYNKSPEVKAHKKMYRERKEVKEHRRNYLQSPELKARAKKIRKNLGDSYIKTLLRNTNIERNLITQEIIDFKRDQILLFRELKKGKEKINGTIRRRNQGNSANDPAV